jgi:hypothetical protein
MNITEIPTEALEEELRSRYARDSEAGRRHVALLVVLEQDGLVHVTTHVPLWAINSTAGILVHFGRDAIKAQLRRDFIEKHDSGGTH